MRRVRLEEAQRAGQHTRIQMYVSTSDAMMRGVRIDRCEPADTRVYICTYAQATLYCEAYAGLASTGASQLTHAYTNVRTHKRRCTQGSYT